MQRAALVHRLQDAAQLCLGGAERSRLLVYLHLDAAAYVPQIQQHVPAARDVSAIGHWGTGDIEVPITHLAELQALDAYLRLAYET